MTLAAQWQARPLGPQDAAAAAWLIRAAFSAQPVPLDPPASALRETAESVAAQIARAGGAAVESTGTLAGAILWEPRQGGLYLARLAVTPSHRGRGIARALLAAAEAEARQGDLPFVHLGTRLVLAENRRLFAGCGFREVASHAHPGFDRPTWIEMRKDLAPTGGNDVRYRPASQT